MGCCKVAFCATPNLFQRNKICLNQWDIVRSYRNIVATIMAFWQMKMHWHLTLRDSNLVEYDGWWKSFNEHSQSYCESLRNVVILTCLNFYVLKTVLCSFSDSLREVINPTQQIGAHKAFYQINVWMII